MTKVFDTLIKSLITESIDWKEFRMSKSPGCYNLRGERIEFPNIQVTQPEPYIILYSDNQLCFYDRECHLHRVDGPAVINNSGWYLYYLHGVRYNLRQFKEQPEVVAYTAGGQRALDILEL
jgi:hypothetical protein